MTTVQVTLEVPKEGKEVADAVIILIRDIVAKKPAAEIAGDALPAAIVAADGFNQIGEELKSKNKSDLAAYLTKQLMDVLGA